MNKIFTGVALSLTVLTASMPVMVENYCDLFNGITEAVEQVAKENDFELDLEKLDSEQITKELTNEID